MRTDDMQKQLDTITRRYNELSQSYQSRINTIQENQSTYERQQAKLLARFDAIEKEKNKYEKSNVRLRTKLRETEAELGHTKTKSASKERELEKICFDKFEQIEQLQSEIKATKKTIIKKTESLQNLEQENTHLKEANKRLKQNNAQLKKKFKEQEEKQEPESREASVSKSVIAELKNTIKQQEQRIAELKQTIHDKNEELETSNEYNQTLEDSLDNYEFEIQELHNEIRGREIIIGDLEVTRTQQSTQLKQIESKRIDAVMHLKHSQTQLKKINHSNRNLKTYLRNVESTSNQKSKEIARQYEKKLSNYDQKLKSFDAALLYADIKNNRKIQSLKKRMNELNKKLEAERRDNERAQPSDYDQKLKSSDAASRQVNIQNNIYLRKIRVLKKQVNELNKKLAAERRENERARRNASPLSSSSDSSGGLLGGSGLFSIDQWNQGYDLSDRTTVTLRNSMRPITYTLDLEKSQQLLFGNRSDSPREALSQQHSIRQFLHAIDNKRINTYKLIGFSGNYKKHHNYQLQCVKLENTETCPRYFFYAKQHADQDGENTIVLVKQFDAEHTKAHYTKELKKSIENFKKMIDDELKQPAKTSNTKKDSSKQSKLSL